MPSDDPATTIVLARGCSPMGRVLGEGLAELGYDPLIIDERTSAGRVPSLRVELFRTGSIQRELLSVTRRRGPLRAVVILPRREREFLDAEQRWERAAVHALDESTSVARAASNVLGPQGQVVLVPAVPLGSDDEERRTPLQGIVELGVAGITAELGVPLVRCPLPLVEQAANLAPAERLLAAINRPHRRFQDVRERAQGGQEASAGPVTEGSSRTRAG